LKLCIPFFLLYGVLYGSAGDSCWHECGHGTAFKTQWKNDAVYPLECFFMMRNPVVWRWSHSRHHTDTIIIGRDPEIIAMRPPDLIKVGLNFFGILDAPQAMAATLRYAFGHLNADEREFIRRTSGAMRSASRGFGWRFMERPFSPASGWSRSCR